MSKLSKKNLLPSGFYDSLAETALKELETNYKIIKKLVGFGYKLIRPSILEFEQSLDKSISSEFFKVTDPISGKMMVLRNDITPQIVRIVRDRLWNGKEIKLSYTGQIFRKTGKGKFAERQITQTGFELIGSDKPQADAEIILKTAEIFNDLGIKNYTIDFCIPNLLKQILGEDIEKYELKKIQKAIEEKNISVLKSNKSLSKIIEIIKIGDEVTDIKSAVKAIGKIKKLIGKKIRSIEDSEKIIALLKTNANISFNILETKNFGYHAGLCHSFISNESFEEIARGGRYEIQYDGKTNIPAVGLTFVLNSLLRVVNK